LEIRTKSLGGSKDLVLLVVAGTVGFVAGGDESSKLVAGESFGGELGGEGIGVL